MQSKFLGDDHIGAEALTFSFEELGPIKEGSFRFKPLTVLSGCNNTGKTYLTYALYGFLSRWLQYLPRPKLDMERLLEEGQIEIDLKPLFDARTRGLNQAARRYIDKLSTVLASDPSRFENTQLHISDDAIIDVGNLEILDSVTAGSQRSLVTLSKPIGTTTLTITLANSGPRFPGVSLERLISVELTRLLFKDLFPKTFIVSTERTGAVAFRGELNLAKNRLLEAANEVKSHEDLDPSELFARLTSSTYPLPVRDNVDFVNQIAAIQSQQSALILEHPELLDNFADLIGGEYRVDRQGELTFAPVRFRGGKLRMGESSSAVRSLVILRFYLLHVAAKGDLLMIDEPELNLHPSNQRKIARLLAKLSNYGVSVFITTHSDYILREFNNLIQLQGAGARAADLRVEHGYAEDEGLEPNRVAVYMLEHSSISKKGKRKTQGITINSAEVDAVKGIDHSTFDETILAMNSLQSELFFLGSEREDVTLEHA